jgi:putative ABC transport system permease protein
MPARRSDAVAVVSQAFQKSHLVSLGQTISLDGRAHTVIGVMPDEFDFPLATEVWAPLALSPEGKARRDVAELEAIGRLKAARCLGGARRAEMAAISSTLAALSANQRRARRSHPAARANGRSHRPVRTDLWCAAGFVLLLACANIGNLQLARFTARQKEMGLRAALGASRLRLVRQLITESLVISAAGGLLGLLRGRGSWAS